MAQAARFSIWKRGFESRWGRRADLPTCGLLRGATPRRSSLPTQRTVLFSLSRRPGIGLRTRLARFDSSQRGQSISAAFSRAAPCPCSRGTRHKPPKLVVQVRFLAGAPQGGTVPSGVHTPGPAGSIPAPASRGASRRAAALIRLSVEVRLLPSRSRFLGVAQPGRAPVPGTGYWGFESLHPDRYSSRFIWVWLNLVEHRFWAPGTGGSNPPIQTGIAVDSSGCGSIW
jgi:hypothetical protein